MTPLYVPSQELCERLKALGFPQKTDFYWVRTVPGKVSSRCCNAEIKPSQSSGIFICLKCGRVCEEEKEQEGKTEFRLTDETTQFYDKNLEYIAAPHVGELGEWLPKSIPEKSAWLKIQTFEDGDWGVEYFVFEKDGRQPAAFFEHSKIEVEARAQMLIYLAEQGLIDPKTL